MENLTYERAILLDIISDEDVKIMQKLKRIRESAKKDYEYFCNNIKFKFNEEYVAYKFIGDRIYRGAIVRRDGRIILSKCTGHRFSFSILCENDLYIYYRDQYFLSKKISSEAEELRDEFRNNAYNGSACRYFIKKIASGELEVDDIYNI